MEQPGVAFSVEQQSYLMRVLTRLELQASQTSYFEPINNMPSKVQVGRVIYFARAVLPDITAEGLWLYTSTGWTQL